jgi:hypothetical protein
LLEGEDKGTKAVKGRENGVMNKIRKKHFLLNFNGPFPLVLNETMGNVQHVSVEMNLDLRTFQVTKSS